MTLSRFMPIFAVLALLGAIVRVLRPDLTGGVDSTTLLYIAVGAALFLAPEVKSLAFGDYKVEFERTARLAQEALTTAQDAQAAAVGTGKTGTTRSSSIRRELWKPEPGKAHDDPWKGAFGGLDVANNRRLSARITGRTGWFKIDITVASTDPETAPLRGGVQFFLHDTFRSDRPVVSVNGQGDARLTLYAYGAFTVGALCDDGATRLELDLAGVPGAPTEFREN